MRIKRIGVTTFVVALLLSAGFAALPTVALADEALNLPDKAFQNALIAAGVDANHDGTLTVMELAQFNGALDLHDKDIANLTGLGYAVSLKSLNLNENSITALPAEIKNCRELASLDIGNNPIAALPPEISLLTKLKTLKLSGTSLDALPADMSRLTSLETLDLSSTSFEALPEQLKALPALTSLSANNMNLSSLPTWIGQCAALQQLRLDGNQLSVLPDLKGLTNLTVLTLNSNNFASLPAQVTDLTSLTRLEMSYNDLGTLPGSINLLTGLQVLRLNGCALEQLPSEVGGLAALRVLELASNDLTALPASVVNLTELRTLDLSINKLSELPFNVFASAPLEELNLNSNYLNPQGGDDLDEINKAPAGAHKQYQEQYSFTGLYSDNGTPRSKECYQGETVSLSPAQAPVGQVFVGWDLNCDGNADTDAGGTGVFVAPSYQDVSVPFTAVFAGDGQAIVTFRAGAHGRVDGSPGTVRRLVDGQIVAGVPVVQVDEGYRFTGWKLTGGDDSLLSSNDVRIQTFTDSAELTAQYADNSANLSALSISGDGRLSPDFYAYSYSYVLVLPDATPDTGSVTLNAAVQSTGATVTIAEGGALPLTVDVARGQSKTVHIVVTAPDASYSKTYTVKIVHANESGAALSDLKLTSNSQSAGTVEPFDPGTQTYHVNLSPDDDKLHIQAGIASGAVVAFQTREGGSFVPSTSGGIDFDVSAGVDFQVNLRVTSPDGYSQRLYQLIIRREWSKDCTLRTLTGSPELTKVSESDSVVRYTMQLPENTPSGVIQFQTNYRFAKAIVSNAVVVDDTATVTLENGESRTVSIQVVAQDPGVTKAYEITVTRAKSTNCTLNTLTGTPALTKVSDSSSKAVYTMLLPELTASGTIRFQTSHPLANATVVNGTAKDGVVTVALENGASRTVSIQVTAQDTSKVKTYEITVTRAISTDCTLSTLTGNPALTKVSDSSSKAVYTMLLPELTASGTIRFQTGSALAKTTVTNGTAANGVVTVALENGASRTVSIQVVAQDTSKVKTYEITATRAKIVLTIPAVKAASASYNSVVLTWGAVAGASGYEIYRATSSAGVYSKVTTITSGSTVAYTNTSLTTGTTYYYKLRAYRTVTGATVFSDYSTVVPAKPVPTTPANVKAASASYNSVKLTWGAVAGAGGYEIYRATSSTGAYSKVTTITSGSTVTYTNTSLTTGTTYYYKVMAYQLVGSTKVYSGYSAVASAKPIPVTPSVKAATASYTSIKLTWGAVAGATKYEVYRATSSTGTYTKLTETASASYTNTGLNTGKPYYYKIRAYRLVGSAKIYSAYSAVATIPATPSVKAASASYSSVKLTWGAVAGATKYEVYRATSSTGTYTKLTETTSASYTSTGLATGKAYYYKVRAYQLVASTKVYSAYSAVVSAKPIPATPSVKAASASYSSIKLTWGAVAGVTKYEVYRAASSTGTYTKLTETTSASYTNTGLTAGKAYYYKARAYRLVGSTKVYSGYSAVVTAKPAPAAPVGVKAARVSSTSVKVSWSAVAGAMGYEVYRATTSSGTYTLMKLVTTLNWTNTGLTTGKTYYYKVKAYRLVSAKVYGGYGAVVYAKP